MAALRCSTNLSQAAARLGMAPVVTIPFLGVRGPVSEPGSDGFALILRGGAAITIRPGPLLTGGAAKFSSDGPRVGDSALKPDILAPGEGIVSTLIGSGTQGTALSGTSMATPPVAGTAALVIQAHPRWQPAAVKSAILNAGNPDENTNYVTRRAGAGTVNPAAAVGTQAYVFANRDQTTMNFGLVQFPTDFTDHRTIRGQGHHRGRSPAVQSPAGSSTPASAATISSWFPRRRGSTAAALRRRCSSTPSPTVSAAR